MHCELKVVLCCVDIAKIDISNHSVCSNLARVNMYEQRNAQISFQDGNSNVH